MDIISTVTKIKLSENDILDFVEQAMDDYVPQEYGRLKDLKLRPTKCYVSEGKIFVDMEEDKEDK